MLLIMFGNGRSCWEAFLGATEQCALNISMTAILCGQTQKFLIASFTFAFLGPRHWPFSWERLAWVPTPCGIAVNLDPTSTQRWLQEPIHFVFLPRTTARQMVSFVELLHVSW